jgi:hypothetical protein
MAQQVLDYAGDGVSFVTDGVALKQAVSLQLQRLEVQYNLYMKEVIGEIENHPAVEVAALFLAVVENDQLAPAALLARGCVDSALRVNKARKDLSYVYNNIIPTAVYRVSVDQAVYYGLGKPE